jgi:hypothetical protein
MLSFLWENISHSEMEILGCDIYIDVGTIRTSRGKTCYKSAFLVHQLLMFFVLARYRVVKIMCSYF